MCRRSQRLTHCDVCVRCYFGDLSALSVAIEILAENGEVRVHVHLPLVRSTAHLDLSGKNAELFGSPPISDGLVMCHF